MHRDLFSAAWSIALDDTLESLAILFPDGFFLSAETDVLLDCLSKSERCLTLGSAMEESLLLVCDESVENLLELVAVTVRVESQTRE